MDQFSFIRKQSGLNIHAAMSRRSEANVKESYLHWYKHHLGVLHGTTMGVIHTEEPDVEYIANEALLKSKSVCLLCRDPFVQCYHDLTSIRAYRSHIQAIFEKVYSTLRWIDLPGGQHLQAVDKNYLMHYIWQITFITNEVDVASKDSARHVRYRFEELLYQVESLGIIIQQFFDPLAHLAQNRALVEDIGDIIETKRKFKWLNVERKIMRIAIKPESTIFTGTKIHDFNRLLTYVRKDCQAWTKFQALPETDKVDIVCKGLMEVSENINELKDLLKLPLKAIKAASGSTSTFLLFRPTLIKHVKSMKQHVKKIMMKKLAERGDNDNVPREDDNDSRILDAFLSETSSHYEYVLRYGEFLVEEIWDIILMTRLCYNFLRENSHNNITLANYDAVLQSKFTPTKLKKLLKPSRFTIQDFYNVDCPETLRKLPIVLANSNLELCLQ